MNEDEYKAFYQGLLDGEKVASREFEQEKHFEGCMPVEALPRAARRRWPSVRSSRWASQIRAHRAASFRVASASPREREQDDVQSGGPQTKLTYPAQAVCFRKVPGLEHAEFRAFRQYAPQYLCECARVLNEELALKSARTCILPGRSPEWKAMSIHRLRLVGGADAGGEAGWRSPAEAPATTALGALLNHLSTPAKHFQPSNVHLGSCRARSPREKEGTQAVVCRSRPCRVGEWLKGLEKEGD